MTNAIIAVPATVEITPLASSPLQWKKPGLFKQLRAMKAARKELRKQAGEGEKASPLAYIALFSMFVGIILGFMGSLWGLYAFFLLFLASPILALIVLFVKPNAKSRKMALVTLGIWFGLVIIGLILLFTHPLN